MIAKKPDAEGFVRHRAAFDARSINKFCKLIQAKMPTMRHFDDFYARPGLITLADFKNFFDCIPLHEDDWQFAVVQTPLGLRMMTHCSYGWKNSAPNAQNITNEMSARVKGMMGYIDDIAIKHDPEAGTQELVDHLEQFFKVCEEFGVLLHPEKFFPFAEEVESLGIKRTRNGLEITDKYRKKVLGLKKPTNTDELRSAIGVIQYIARYIYMYALFAYWLVILLNEFEGKTTIKWTPEADVAWDTIKKLVAEAPVLAHPTREGQFCMKCDGCPYGVGAVLYQWQFDPRLRSGSWKIIDMFSKIIPQSQRYNHCIISEALAVLWPAQHWVIYLLPKPFIVSTDHKALLKVFKDDTDLTNLVQKQLLRIRLALSDFEFEIRHVPGIDNKLPDILSRFGAKLIELNAIDNISAFKASDNKLETLSKIQLDELNQELKQLEKQTKKLKYSSQINNIVAELNANKDKWQAALQNLEDNVQNERKQFKNRFKHLDVNLQLKLENLVENEVSSDVTNWDNIDLCMDNECITKLVHNVTERTFEKVICTLEQLTMQQQTQSTDSEVNQTFGRQTCTAQYMTRSKMREMKEQTDKIGFVDSDEKALDKQIRFRQDFLDCVNKYKMPTYIFERKAWIGYQDLDQQCQLIKMYLKDEEETRKHEIWGPRLQALEANETEVYNKLIGGAMTLTDNGIIEVQYYRELDKKISRNLFVPLKLRKEITQYAHHNPYTQHFGWKQTFYNLESKFWWPDMKYDARKWVQSCLVCLYTKGQPTNIAPMQIRKLPKTKEHLMADFIHCRGFYILVLIDYSTGYVMLEACDAASAQAVSNMIFQRWIPILGWFKTFETDYGTAFDNNVLSRICKALKIEMKFSEPYNHKGTGKVEAKIKFIQQIINSYNVESGGVLTNTSRSKAKSIIKALLPFIQFSLNQKQSRFTAISPNMLMFGSQLREIIDIDLFESDIMKDLKSDTSDSRILQDLITQLKQIRKTFKKDWRKYIWLSKQYYDRKHNIQRRQAYNRANFCQGKKVLYYIGDKPAEGKKWRQRWSGPWNILKRVNERTIIIGDKASGATADVSVDRCKPYKKSEMHSFQNYDKMIRKRIVKANKLQDRGNYSRDKTYQQIE